MNVSGRIHLIHTGSSKHATRQLNQGWEYLRSVFRDSPEGICVIDRSMRVVVWNRTAAEITGYGASEVLGRPCRIEGNDLKIESTSQAEGLIVREAQKGGQPLACALRVKKKSADGTWLSLPTTVIPLRHKELAFLIHIVRSLPYPMGLLYHHIDSLISQHFNHQSKAGSAGNHEPPLPALTRREQEILRLLACGKTAKPIATEMSLSVATVRTHIQSILRKLKVHSCLEAAVWLLSRPAGFFERESLLNFQ